MQTSEVLNQAADLIEERGWTQGDWEGSGLCLEGGILAALGADKENRPWWSGEGCPAFDAVVDYLNLEGPGGSVGAMPWEWNDKVGRTADEVIGVLRAAALVEAARETLPVGVLRMGDIAVPIPASARC